MMKRSLLLGIVLAVCSLGIVKGQTVSDSLAIVSAQWKIESPQKGIIHKYVSIPRLYQVPQSISLIEIDPGAGLKVGVAVSDKMRETSRMASEQGAIAAINGSYFDMKRGNSVCFLKVDRQVVDTTTLGEFARRVTGAVSIRKGKMKIISWNRQIEKQYKGKKGIVLASGPLMLKDGRYYDWSLCEKDFIRTKHPRSAVALTKDGKILFITVDGRFPKHAGGVSIPELAHLIRILGGKDAINLDGGGSTTLWLSGAPDNGIVNYPCDNKRFDHRGERTVPNILYVHD
ncbi:phosphodiester glycosidase family protein [uncultured Bacteroides sp.]|uniref:phosphodiester glycosidase family protein n=1 Tax=uncultured Bacteroides sp. TaxID=162156 RepID=UPI000822DC41|nr:phosphodiester glycosidase family protein [uncultured Bacteroides sp.]SCG95485.1 Exopolysaccharide biosynthesis protein related to N-acetylglucosamine-1-phosphodiester alpha-N-acetylglucosaminidase [uncultured Bacteroides sp.]